MSDTTQNEDATPAPTEKTTVDVERLADEIEAAPLGTLGETQEEEDDLVDIIEALVTGDLPPEKADDAIRDWVNRQVDIPFIGEAAENRLLKVVQRTVKSVVVSIIRRF